MIWRSNRPELLRMRADSMPFGLGKTSPGMISDTIAGPLRRPTAALCAFVVETSPSHQQPARLSQMSDGFRKAL